MSYKSIDLRATKLYNKITVKKGLTSNVCKN